MSKSINPTSSNLEPTNSNSEPNRISTMAQIRNYVRGKKEVTRAELVEMTGKSEVWISCAMSILNNPSRSEKTGIIRSTYNRSTKTFIIAE